MMKSVALLDSGHHDEDFVIVGNFSDLDEHHVDDEAAFGDNDSYDYCEDVLSLSSSVHQTITSTSNPLQVVQEDFFAGNRILPPSHIADSSLDSSIDHHPEDEADPDTSDLSNRLPVQDTSSSSTCMDPSADEASFNASTTDSSQLVSEREGSRLIVPASKEGDDAEGIASGPLEPAPPQKSCSGGDTSTPVYSLTLTETVNRGTTTVEKTDNSRAEPSKSESLRRKLKHEKPSDNIIVTRAAGDEDGDNDDDSLSSSQQQLLHRSARGSVKVVKKKKRRKQLKIAQKAAAAAAAAAALGQLTLRSSHNSSSGSTSNSPKRRKGRASSKKVANIAVVEALKSHQEFKQMTAAAASKKL